MYSNSYVGAFSEIGNGCERCCYDFFNRVQYSMFRGGGRGRTEKAKMNRRWQHMYFCMCVYWWYMPSSAPRYRCCLWHMTEPIFCMTYGSIVYDIWQYLYYVWHMAVLCMTYDSICIMYDIWQYCVWHMTLPVLSMTYGIIVYDIWQYLYYVWNIAVLWKKY